MKIQNKKDVILADKFTWSKFERTACGPQGERQDACNNRVSRKSLKAIYLISRWIMKYIHVFHPSDQRYELRPAIRLSGWPSAIQICSRQI